MCIRDRDTPDQQTATQLVKQDMESPVPMDRLVCGDVGFGKTEIAIRAAFKACLLYTSRSANEPYGCTARPSG